MDPNEALAEIRKLIKEGLNGEEVSFDLAATVEALDEWITKGGSLPRAWAQGGAA